jgi:hypothetical protein
MACSPSTAPLGCLPDPTGIIGGVVSSVAGSAWEAVCKSFGDALVALLSGFASAFTAFPAINPADAGIRSVYSLSLGIAAVVAALMLLVQIARTVVTHDGTALAYGIVGLGKAVLAFLLTLTVTGAALAAADELTRFIVTQTFGTADGLKTRLGAVFAVDALANGGNPSLLLFVAVIGILLVLVLWFELLLGNAAVAVLIGTSPIAAAGQTSTLTAGWWPKLVSGTTQLIILKPVIALVFAVGFDLAGNATDLAGILSGLLVLLLAVLAWPAVARFFTFASVHMGGGTGLAAVLGFAAGRMNGSSAGAGAPGMPSGLAGDDFTAASEQRTLAAHSARAGTAGAGAGAGGSAAGSGAAGAAGGGAAAGAAAAAGPALVVAAALDAAQRAANALTGRMEQTAGYAGLDGNPHPYPAGYPRHAPVPFPRPTSGSEGGGSAGAGDGGSDPAWPDGGTRPGIDTTTTAHGSEAPDAVVDEAGWDTTPLADPPPADLVPAGLAPADTGPGPESTVPVGVSERASETTTEDQAPAGDRWAGDALPGAASSPPAHTPPDVGGHEASVPGLGSPDGPVGGGDGDARVERRAVRRPDPPSPGPGPGSRSGPGAGVGWPDGASARGERST